jgi:hypothetical protein
MRVLPKSGPPVITLAVAVVAGAEEVAPRCRAQSPYDIIIYGGCSIGRIPRLAALILRKRQEVRERTGTTENIAIIGLDGAVRITVASCVGAGKVDTVVCYCISSECAGNAIALLVNDVVGNGQAREPVLGVHRRPAGHEEL